MEAFSSSTPFFVIRDDDQLNQFNDQQHQQSSPAQQPPFSATANPPGILPAKKKRNHPGNPNPDAEVIALSPKTLMATNRFICEVCNKGFQREQNLQLHRRGHNLPWKLKQKSTKEVRRRVYLCPEPGCVHHDPSRALGDLTGVKKHFSRKHGEKKWKCDKCSKRYAVQSDCKAHSKTCGTREYRCDCGTLFSRRDSFITHRAFCDALAQENSRFATGLTTFGSHLYRNNDGSNISLGLSPDLLRLGIPTSAPSAQSISLASTQFDHLVTPTNPPFSYRPPHLPPSASNFFLGCDSLQSKPSFHGLTQFPSLQPNSSHNPSSNLYNLNFFSNGGNEAAMPLMVPDQFNCGNLVNDHMHSLFNGDNEVLPQMSATALLQRAAEMGSTSNMGDQMLRTQVESHEKQLMDIMNSFANGSSNVFGGGQEKEEGGATKFEELEAGLCNMEEGGYQSAGLTRDFLGVGTMLRSMGRGMALDPRDMNNSATSGRSFLGEDL